MGYIIQSTTMLYLVPTPIGNLEDMTLRSLRVLKEVDLILAEDTRTSGVLLKHYEISKPVRSFHMHNEHQKLQEIIDLLEAGTEIAMITDAGTPGISDPGFLLVRACREADIAVTCLPGASAIIPALAASGIPCDKFFFEGFLPQKKGRQTRLKYIAEVDSTVVLYESPHRLVKCLEQLAEFTSPNRIACVCREISKLHEEFKKGTLQELIQYYKFEGKSKGEIAIVLSTEIKNVE